METDILNNFNVKNDEVMEITSSGPVEYKPPTEEDDEEEPNTIIDETEVHSKGKKRKLDEDGGRKPKVDPTMELEGMIFYYFVLFINYYIHFSKYF